MSNQRLIELIDLADDYPMADYLVGSHRMVTKKRHVLGMMVFFFLNVMLFGVSQLS